VCDKFTAAGLPRNVRDAIDGGSVSIADGRIVIALDGVDRLHWVRPYQDAIAAIAQRVTRTARPVELVNTQTQTQYGG